MGAFPGIAERLVEARKRLGLHQKEMAQHLGVSLRTYQHSEMGRRAIDVDEVGRLAELGIDAGWLLTGKIGFAESQQAPFAHLDAELMGRVVEALATVYKEENQELKPADQGRMAAEIYDTLVAIGDETDRPGALRYAIEMKRRQLRQTRA